jgi:hypothetical protein
LGESSENAEPLDAMEPLATIRRDARGRFKRQARKKTRFDAGRRRRFLEALADTSNVRHAARKAGISPCTAYYRRDVDAAFAEAWQVALAEGHARLELEMLHRARFGTRSTTTERDREGLKKEVERIDFRDSVALHLLTRHDRKQAVGVGSGSVAARSQTDLERQRALEELLWREEQATESDNA